LRAENAALRDLSYECLHDFTGNTGCGFGSNTPGDCPNCQRPLTPQTWRDRAMSAAAKIPHLMAENAALREERDAERAKRIVAEHNKMLSLLGRSSEQELREENLRTKLAETEIERDALKAELLRPLAWREGATIEKAERELAEARAEIAKLKDEKQFLFSELRNRPPSQFGIIGGPDAHKCPPSLMEDWRGANEDWRKEKG
jgi:hypothetical protein